MNWYYNLRLKTKLLSGFIMMVLVAGIIVGVGVLNL